MSTHRALVLKSTSEPLSITILPIPTPTPGSVTIRVLAQAIVPYLRAVLTGVLPYTLSTPLIPGANCIGRIHAVGPDAISLTPGQLVFCDMTVRARDDPDKAILMGLHGGIGEEKKLMEGVWRDGSFAEYARWPVENVHVIDEEVVCKKLGYSVEDLCGISSKLLKHLILTILTT
jgi:NADPH:quinone reductase-like Zn-dependent oxidoreductase